MTNMPLPRLLPSIDVLVIGSGIAGCCAAIEAARAGARVAMACAGKLFSGSSFYPGTWGLGLIGPENDEDADDLVDTICHVGCGVADRNLVRTLVEDIRPGMAWLEQLGVELTRPASDSSAREAAFIPCFDHKNRLWRGLTREPMERAFAREIERLGAVVLEHHELIDLLEAHRDDGRVGGALLFDHPSGELSMLPACAVILAAGGTGGLFERSLTSRDVLSSVHGIALRHGCNLINIEFMQMMPGLVSPVRGVVFNEKSFRYANFKGTQPDSKLLEQRSAYGPFTCRLASRAIDLAIDEAGPDGLALRYVFPKTDVPEFVRTFSAWLEDAYDITADDDLRIAMYAHAANGGIRINADGSCGVPGLYAAGEVTGGMHGADRIGGLSSANGLVFGRRAGRAAAAWCREVSNEDLEGVDAAREMLRVVPALTEQSESKLVAQLRATMSAHCMINRTEVGLNDALKDIAQIHAEAMVIPRVNTTDGHAGLARGARLVSRLDTARAMITAMRERRESLGSHYRADFPPATE